MINDKFGLEVMLPMAEAAYDPYIDRRASQVLPAGWKVVNLIQLDNFGFVASDGKDICISIRGTETPGEWMEDFEALPCCCRFATPKVNVHRGFQDVYLKIRYSVHFSVVDLPSTASIYVTGHSLGAALAVLCAYDLAYSFSKTPQVYTWAGPRVGTPTFAADFNRRIPECRRYVNIWDVVPNVPLPVMGYKHEGVDRPLDGGRTLDLKVAHSLTSYRTGLTKFLKK